MKDRKKNSRFKEYGKSDVYGTAREHRSSFIVYFVLRFLVIVMMVLQLLNRNYENVFLCVLTLGASCGAKLRTGDIQGGTGRPPWRSSSWSLYLRRRSSERSVNST